MEDTKGNRKQLTAWLLTAMLAPLAQNCGSGWGMVLLACAVMLPINRLPGSLDGLKKLELLLLWVSVVAAAGILLPAAGACWPGRASETVVPITLIILAALAGTQKKSANAAGMLYWITGAILIVVLLLGIRGIRPDWLKPVRRPLKPVLLLTLLLPRLRLLQDEKPHRTNGLILLLALILTVLVQGNLSAGEAFDSEAPFYEVARSLRIGSLSRLEPVVSVMMTLSWFCLSSYLVMTGKTALERFGSSSKKALWWTAGAVSAVVFLGKGRLPGTAAAAVGFVWMVLPEIHFGKKIEKRRKSG